jgi:spore germination protein YaaH
MTLMTYDHHNRTTPLGPVAGYDWVAAALDYATARGPSQKILLGIPLCGREWIQSGDVTSAHTLTFADAQNRLEQFGERLWDERWRTPWFQYRDDSGFHTGWYEDSKSLEAKLELVEKYHLRGFAAWRLGVEDPGFWTLGAVKARTGQRRSKHSPARPPIRAAVGAEKPLH